MDKILRELEGHQVRVAFLMLEFGKRLNFSEIDLKNCIISGLEHDSGKKDVDIDVLSKPGKLNDEEYEIVRSHVYYSVERLSIDNKIVEKAIFEHHENYDGTGYPLGLKMNEISLLGRMLRIVDVYDALRTKRVYKPKFDYDKTIDIMESEKSFYDPQLFKVFKQVIKHNDRNISVMFNNDNDDKCTRMISNYS